MKTAILTDGDSDVPRLAGGQREGLIFEVRVRRSGVGVALWWSGEVVECACEDDYEDYQDSKEDNARADSFLVLSSMGHCISMRGATLAD